MGAEKCQGPHCLEPVSQGGTRNGGTRVRGKVIAENVLPFLDVLWGSKWTSGVHYFYFMLLFVLNATGMAT